MKHRPDGFLAESKIAHDSEVFDYIRELHDYLWFFIRHKYPSASGYISEYLKFDPKEPGLLAAFEEEPHLTARAFAERFCVSIRSVRALRQGKAYLAIRHWGEDDEQG